MKKWLKRIGLGVMALLVIALAAGAVSEQLARRRAPHQFAAPGRLLDTAQNVVNLLYCSAIKNLDDQHIAT